MEVVGENRSELELTSVDELEFVLTSLDGFLASKQLKKWDRVAGKAILERLADADVHGMISQEAVTERLSPPELRLCISALRWHIDHSETMQLRWFRQNYEAFLANLEQAEQVAP